LLNAIAQRQRRASAFASAFDRVADAAEAGRAVALARVIGATWVATGGAD
jgi:hypothetical protein